MLSILVQNNTGSSGPVLYEKGVQNSQMSLKKTPVVASFFQ